MAAVGLESQCAFSASLASYGALSRLVRRSGHELTLRLHRTAATSHAPKPQQAVSILTRRTKPRAEASAGDRRRYVVARWGCRL